MTNTPNRWTITLAGLATACALAACGGGSNSSAPVVATPGAVTPAPTPTPTPATPTPQPGAPASVGNVAIDGRNWINFRRTQIGVPVMTPNAQIDRAAQSHSDYQRLNDEITHDQVAGKPGFTGVKVLNRLNAAGYNFTNTASYAYGEVISATTNNSGFYMADELITAIYHRFVIFEPMFKEIGTGSATTPRSYTYFTANFTANNGYGPGIGAGAIVSWPFSGQVGVTPNFFSDYEAPDPIPDANEVGYPVSVHANISAILTVTTFTIRQRGGPELSVKLLQRVADIHTPDSAAAIVPREVLKPATTYDVAFTGTVDGVVVTKNWSFTTK